MILIFIIVLSVLVTFALYAAAAQFGLLPKLNSDLFGGDTGTRGRVTRRRDSTRLGDRLESVPRGCLISAVVGMGIWIFAWLIFLVVGLRFLWTVGR